MQAILTPLHSVEVKRSSRARSRPPVLIIVESDPSQFALLKKALWKSGATARVWWAQDAADALEIIGALGSSTTQISLVADLNCAALAGSELLRRAEDGPRPIRLAVLTGCEDADARERAFAFGAKAFFQKQESWDQLLETARALQQFALGVC
ncbi:MAG: response regulator [Verrucomicrobiota bacterium]